MDIEIQGYKLDGMRFIAILPILGNPERDPAKETLKALELRDHGLEGGKIQVQLTDENRTASDPGYTYELQHFPYEQETVEGGIGQMEIRRMDPKGEVIEKIQVELEDLDRSHLLERIQFEVLNWHAQTLGPFSKRKVKPR